LGRLIAESIEHMADTNAITLGHNLLNQSGF